MIPSRHSLNWMPEENLDFNWLNVSYNFFSGDFLDLFYKKTVLKLIRNFRWVYLIPNSHRWFLIIHD